MKFLLIYRINQFKAFNPRCFELYCGKLNSPHKEFLYSLEGKPLKETKTILEIEMRKNGYIFPSFSHGVKNYLLSETVGIRLTLLFALMCEIKDYTNTSRNIVNNFVQLDYHECCYWYGLLRSGEQNPKTVIISLQTRFIYD